MNASTLLQSIMEQYSWNKITLITLIMEWSMISLHGAHILTYRQIMNSSKLLYKYREI